MPLMRPLGISLFLAALTAACGSDDTASGGGGTGGASGGAGGVSGGGGSAASAGSAGGGGMGCSAGEKPCNGTCVSVLDPATGCSQESCAPCGDDPNSQYGCSPARGGAKCVIVLCLNGFFDCDQAPIPLDCETNLEGTTPAGAPWCGSCGVLCQAPETCQPDPNAQSPKPYSCQ